MGLEDLPESCGDLLVLGCAQCGWDMVADKTDSATALQHRLKVFGGRAGGRPYCRGCYCSANRPRVGNSRATKDDISPWQENVIREMEDGHPD